MKRSNVITVLLVLSAVLFLAGLFTDENLMRLCAIGIMLLTAVAFYLTWVNPQFLTKKTVLTNLSIATAYAFIALMVLTGLTFLISIFVLSSLNLNFAIFGSIFVSMTVARFYVARLVEDYLGGKEIAI
jgi:hypothetical protein